MATLIFTVAQNGYGIGYSKCLRSHAQYAATLDATYVAVVRPFRVKEPALSAWLKIPLMLHALRAGYEWVVFVDADCLIRPSAPDFRSIRTPQKSVYMALGRSERVNSGVMFATGPEGADFFDKVLGSLTTEIPSADRKQLKYENGNVIYCAQQSTDVQTIDLRWNNTFEPQLDDYFRHYTGPMRDEYQRSSANALAFRIARSFAATPTAQPGARDAAFVARLRDLTQQCCTIYPAFVELDEAGLEDSAVRRRASVGQRQ